MQHSQHMYVQTSTVTVIFDRSCCPIMHIKYRQNRPWMELFSKMILCKFYKTDNNTTHHLTIGCHNSHVKNKQSSSDHTLDTVDCKAHMYRLDLFPPHTHIQNRHSNSWEHPAALPPDTTKHGTQTMTSKRLHNLFGQ